MEPLPRVAFSRPLAVIIRIFYFVWTHTAEKVFESNVLFDQASSGWEQMLRTLKFIIITLPDVCWSTDARYHYSHTHRHTQTPTYIHIFPAQLVNVWSWHLKTCPSYSMNHTDVLMRTNQKPWFTAALWSSNIWTPSEDILTLNFGVGTFFFLNLLLRTH